ncbi:hypothetical protein CYMTET_24199 [Cymbomonas tetramitiformis]|uniref:Uncharacterized protein n=1 Tax=Cymbomonas tetramitiformis TaxID=36881 RepID=A0AAE0FWM1_9CHLO|nr:hypothetical protein CYMTET_24199 [Cymbomonas tetramitiformis]
MSVPGNTGHVKPFDWYIVFLPNGAVQWKWARKGTPEPLTAYFGERKPGLDYSWQHIIVHPSGALRRWERKRGGGWFLEDATRAKEPVAPFSLPLSNAFWKQASVTDEYGYRGIPYTGRKSATPTNSDDSGAGAVTWSKEKLPDSDDNDDAGVTDSKHDMDTASPKWVYDSPEYDDTEDDVSEFDDLVADDAEEQAEARRLKRLGLQLIMDDTGELIWVPKGTSPTSPVQPEDQPITEQKSEAISDDAPAPVVETARVQPKDPSGPDTGLTSMSGDAAGVAEVTKRVKCSRQLHLEVVLLCAFCPLPFTLHDHRRFINSVILQRGQKVGAEAATKSDFTGINNQIAPSWE